MMLCFYTLISAVSDALSSPKDHASVCAERESQSVRVYPWQLHPFAAICESRGWKGRCTPPCTQINVDKARTPGAGAPCLSMRHPDPHPKATAENTAALLARAAAASAAAADGGTAFAVRTEWRGKILRVRSFVQDGFWVRAHFVLTQGMWASMRHLPFFVDLYEGGAACSGLSDNCTAHTPLHSSSKDGRRLDTAHGISRRRVSERRHGATPISPSRPPCKRLCDAYSSLQEDSSVHDPHGVDAGWEEYFDPINGIPAREMRRRYAGDANVLEMSCAAGWFFNRGVLGGQVNAEIYALNWQRATAYRERNAALVRAWVRVRERIRQRADAEWDRLIRRAQGAAVIGVHLRGTDKYQSPKVPPEQYFGLIDAFFRHHRARNEERRGRGGHSGRNSGGEAAMIFLATDDIGYQQAMIQRYGGARIIQLFDGQVRRATGNSAIWQEVDAPVVGVMGEANSPPVSGGESHGKTSPVERGRHADVAFERGVQVLLDTLLLAKCDFLLKSASSVSEFAIYFSPRLINASFDFSLGDQPLPSWA
jgi:hypothetical protein